MLQNRILTKSKEEKQSNEGAKKNFYQDLRQAKQAQQTPLVFKI